MTNLTNILIAGTRDCKLAIDLPKEAPATLRGICVSLWNRRGGNSQTQNMLRVLCKLALALEGEVEKKEEQLRDLVESHENLRSAYLGQKLEIARLGQELKSRELDIKNLQKENRELAKLKK